jgi:hypothetical protein
VVNVSNTLMQGFEPKRIGPQYSTCVRRADVGCATCPTKQECVGRPMSMYDECGEFRVAISFDYANVRIILLDEVEGFYKYPCDPAMQKHLQDELSAMVRLGKARKSMALMARIYYV